MLNPQEVIYEGNAEEVILPGEDGEFSVLDFHQAFLYCLRPGIVRIRQKFARGWENAPSSKKKSNLQLKIKRGLAKMISDELVLLVE
ncbi:MAG: hypothetical protein ACE5GG_01465 [Candidatus Omnitrophota bacterium]